MKEVRKPLPVKLNSVEHAAIKAFADSKGVTMAEAVRSLIALTMGTAATDPAAILRNTALVQGATEFYFLPEDRQQLLTDILAAIASSSLMYMTHYVFSNQQIISSILNAGKANICHILLDHSQAVSPGTTSYTAQEIGLLSGLAQAGAEIICTSSPINDWNNQPYIEHSKSAVIYDSYPEPLIVTGSMNWTGIGPVEGNIVSLSRSTALADKMVLRWQTTAALGLSLYPEQPFPKVL